MSVLSCITLPAQIECLQEFIGTVSTCAKDQGFSQKRIRELELAVEEALMNIFNYSYSGEAGEAEIICQLENNTFVVMIIDSGIPFDIRTAAEPDVTTDVAHREMGGLGIHIIKHFMDDVRYRREGNRNILSLVLKKEPR